MSVFWNWYWILKRTLLRCPKCIFAKSINSYFDCLSNSVARNHAIYEGGSLLKIVKFCKARSLTRLWYRERYNWSEIVGTKPVGRLTHKVAYQWMFQAQELLLSDTLTLVSWREFSDTRSCICQYLYKKYMLQYDYDHIISKF